LQGTSGHPVARWEEPFLVVVDRISSKIQNTTGSFHWKKGKGRKYGKKKKRKPVTRDGQERTNPGGVAGEATTNREALGGATRLLK